MKKKTIFWWMIAMVVVSTLLLTVLGIVFGKSEVEKSEGLSGHFDISKEGSIAYVHYTDGRPEIRLYDPANSTENVIPLEDDKYILDPTFTNEASLITYIATNRNVEEDPTSSVRQYNLQTNEDKELFSVPSVITEIAFSPVEDSLFYLQAGTYENYSPLASKRPHDFDVHEYKISENRHVQHTNLKEYSMESLHISEDGESVFVQMLDDAEAETAEDIFNNVKQRIFEIPLSQPDTLRIVSDPNRDIDINGFTIIPNRQDFIFQSVANINEGDLYHYELYHFNKETKEEQQLTHLKEYAGNPKVVMDLKKIYFIVDKQFAKATSDYHLFRMNLDGTDMEELPLPVNE